MCKNKLTLFNIYNKPILWGQLDSKILIQKIKSSIKEDINYLEIDLEKIQSLDASYISSAFVHTLKSAKSSGKELVYIFSNIVNDEIVFQLSSILLSNNIFSFIKTETEIEIIGDASYFKKIILKNIHENEVINPVSICKEFDKPFESYKIEFEEFVTVGILEKESDEVYKTNLSFAF